MKHSPPAQKPGGSGLFKVQTSLYTCQEQASVDNCACQCLCFPLTRLYWQCEMETEWCVILEKNVRCCKNQCLLQNVPNFVTVNYYKALISHHCRSPVNQFHQLIRLFCNILTIYRAYILYTKYRLPLMLKYNYWLKYNSSLNSHYKWTAKVLKNKTKSNKYQQHISFWLALSIWQWTRHLVSGPRSDSQNSLPRAFPAQWL